MISLAKSFRLPLYGKENGRMIQTEVGGVDRSLLIGHYDSLLLTKQDILGLFTTYASPDHFLTKGWFVAYYNDMSILINVTKV